MEGIKELAKAYYERAPKEEKKARAYFKKLDENRDGGVSLLEFQKSVIPWLSKEKIFRQLDVNGDGFLDLHEVSALYFMEKRNFSRSCDGCLDLLVGPFFSCLLCLPKRPATVNLCCDCYRKGDFKHVHERSNFMDHHSLLNELMTRHANEEPTQWEIEMKELRKVARAHYEASSDKVKKLAKGFFNSMDSDRDGQVDLSEFLAFMKQKGHYEMKNPNFFKQLDRDGNGTLDFMEAVTLYYIIKSGRPFCDGCGNFIPGMFFSCVECSLTQCFDCYRSKDCKHNIHKGRTLFLDNYTLLQAKSHTTQNDKPSPNVYHSNSTPSASTAVVPASKLQITHHHHYNSTAIVPASNNKNKFDVAYKALEAGIAAAVAAGNIASSLCTIL